MELNQRFLEKCLTIAQQAAKRAALILRRGFKREEIKTTRKGKENLVTDLVTSIDIKAQKIIIDTIYQTFPNHQFFAEEGIKKSIGDGFTWIIDPLDGTLGFSKRILPYSLTIALVYQRQPILGLIYNPETKEMFWATRFAGAFKNGQRIYVSSCHQPQESTVFLTGAKRGILDILAKKKRQLTGLGAISLTFSSSCYENCLVAEGKIDGMIQITQPKAYWDYVASCLIVSKAGGKISTFAGKIWTIDDYKHILSNGRIHQALLDLVQGG